MQTHKRECKDNLSENMINYLSNWVLLHILSFSNTKEAVQTSILSKRWINLWKTLPTLILSPSHFRTHKKYKEFVSQILSLRDDSTSIYTLEFHHTYYVGPSLIQRIMKYVVSHNVQHLIIDLKRDMKEFPSCFFSCHTQMSLNLFSFCPKTIFPNSLNLLLLTSFVSKVLCLLS